MIPEGAVAIIEAREINSYEWETICTIGPDYSGGELEDTEFYRYEAVRIRTIWDEDDSTT
jgi:hypothetical protein